MQSVRSRIWTRVAVSNSCDDNHYTTGTFSRDISRNWGRIFLWRQETKHFRYAPISLPVSGHLEDCYFCIYLFYFVSISFFVLLIFFLIWSPQNQTKRNLKKKNNYTKNVDIKWMRLTNLSVWNNPRRTDMPLKSINQSIKLFGEE